MADVTIKVIDIGLADLSVAIRNEGKVDLLIYSKAGHLDRKEILAIIAPLLKRLAEKR
jgi:hypothetical protein